MENAIQEPKGRGHATDHAPECRPAPKWAAVVGDRLFPMPRRKLTARTVLDQSGCGTNVVLQRDHGSPNDCIFADNEEVDLGQGNVFRAIPRCETGEQGRCLEPAKRAFVIDDAWETTLVADQTGRSLKALFGVPADAQILRDYESPNDLPIADDEPVYHHDGCVFTLRKITITIKVNNNPVKFTQRRQTALNVKKAAIAQGVDIKEDFVLYPLSPEGNQGPAIPDNTILYLKDCQQFRCLSEDDNS